jgi:hypothetical protein
VRSVWECWRYYNVDSGKTGAKKTPRLVSFGNGKIVDPGLPNLDMTSKIRSAVSMKEYKRLKNSFHGVDTKRNAPKGGGI